MDSSVYNGINQCRFTMLETLVHKGDYPDGTIVQCFKDTKGQLRIVAFKSVAHSKGYAGVLVYPDGEIRYKETCPAMRGRGTTRQLQALLTSWGFFWYPSLDITDSGMACYRRPISVDARESKTDFQL